MEVLFLKWLFIFKLFLFKLIFIMNLSNIERAHMNKPRLMMGGMGGMSGGTLKSNPYGTQGFNQF